MTEVKQQRELAEVHRCICISSDFAAKMTVNYCVLIVCP